MKEGSGFGDMVDAFGKLTVMVGDMSHAARELRVSPPIPDGLQSESGSPPAALKQFCAADRIEAAYRRDRDGASCDLIDIQGASLTWGTVTGRMMHSATGPRLPP